jgi:Methyltransferase domain
MTSESLLSRANWKRQLDVPAMAALHRGIVRALDPIPIDFFGGCSVSKGFVMAELIRRFDLKTSVDIGIYRGRSFFPQAVAHRQFTGGVVYGIDPYSMGEALENDCGTLKEQVAEFAARLDFDGLYQAVERSIVTLGVERNAKLLRKTSMQAIPDMAADGVRFGLIHIDGNHDTVRVMEDVGAYVPRLQPGGFVILDDISWESVRPAYDQLSRTMSHLFEHIDRNRMNDYAVFGADLGFSSALALRGLLKAVRWRSGRPFRQ